MTGFISWGPFGWNPVPSCWVWGVFHGYHSGSVAREIIQDDELLHRSARPRNSEHSTWLWWTMKAQPTGGLPPSPPPLPEFHRKPSNGVKTTQAPLAAALVAPHKADVFRRVETRCIVNGEAQQSPLFWLFFGGVWFSHERLCTRSSTTQRNEHSYF